MLEDVLAVARAPLHPPDELDDLGMQSVDTGLVCGLLAGFHDRDLDLLARLRDDFLDAPRMDSAIRDELLEGEARRLAPDRIEAGHDDGVGCVVDDDVDSGRELESPDVPPLPPDDP